MQIMPCNSWSSFKTLILNKKLSIQYIDSGASYELFAPEVNTFLWSYTLCKDNGSDQTDFETNYKTNANKEVSAHIIVSGIREFDGDVKYLYRKSFKYDITPNTTNTFDEKFTFSVFLYGGIYELIGNINDGDYVEISIVDKDNILGYGANTVLATFIEQEFINSEKKFSEITSEGGQQIPAGIYLRAKYVSVDSANAPKLIIRYKMRRA